MNIAWLVMLPWGMVNVAAVAVWVEYGKRWSTAAGLPEGPAAALFGGMVLIAAWLATMIVGPETTDNRPRRQPVAGRETEGGIELTSLYDLSGKSREEMAFDKEKLLSVYDQTKDAEPTRTAREDRP